MLGEELEGRPVSASNSVMSEPTTRERPMMATLWPRPVRPVKSGVLRSKMVLKSPGVM